MGKTQAAGQR